MTKKEAKEITLEVWRYLAEHPEITHKYRLPRFLWEQIRSFIFFCPLCELYKDDFAVCPKCPLQYCTHGSYYDRWCKTYDIHVRKEAAQGIVDTVQAWEPEEETE